MNTIKQLLKLLLGGSTLRASERTGRKTIPGYTIFWNGSSWRRSRILDQNIVLPSLCVFRAFKAFNPSNLGMIAIDARGSWSQQQLESLLETALEPETKEGRNGKSYVSGLLLNGEKVACKDWKCKNGTKYTINAVGLNSHLRGLVSKNAMKALGVNNIPFPSHPGWITARNKPGVFYVLVSLEGDMFAEIATEAFGGPVDPQIINVLRIRAGKDGWGEILTKTERYRILVFKEELSEKGESKELLDLDGAFFIKSSSILSEGEWALVKGKAFLENERTGIVKARMIHSPEQTAVGPNGIPIPEDVDGWSYSSSIKWNQPTFPDGQDSMVITFSVGVTTKEDHEQKDAYKANLFYQILGVWAPSTVKYLEKLLRDSAIRVARNLDDLRGYMNRRVKNGLADSEDNVMSDSYISKYVYGLLPVDDHGVQNALNKLGKGFMSAYVPGSVYAGIIHKTHIAVENGQIYELQPGEFVPTKEMREAIISGFHMYSKATGQWSNSICSVRYPNITEGSFLGLKMSDHTATGISGVFAIVCLEAQLAQQSDCDDHDLFLPGAESKIGIDGFTPIEKHIKPAQGDLTPWSAYHHGRRSQELTALFVAAYMKCLATVYEYAPDKIGEAKSMLINVGQAIQDSVQGIKKFNDTCMSLGEIYELCSKVIALLAGNSDGSNVADVISGKVVDYKGTTNLAQAVNEVYGIDFKMSVLDTHTPKATLSIQPTAEERDVLNSIWKVLVIEKSRRHPHMLIVESLLENVVGVTRQALIDDESLIDSLDPEKIKRAIYLYALFMVTLAQRGKHKQVRSLNGLALVFTEDDLAE